ncbi:MAG TPA: flagellar basal body-associated FliL family protein [Alphaproteobacteria bacterium]|nr:flagellar basal body-associated FliL family protein [Alphaproteobacteria bacterium]
MASDSKEEVPLSADSAEALGAAEESRFSAKKIVLFVLLPLAVIGGALAGAYKMGYLDKVLPGHEVDCSTVKEGDEDYAGCIEKLAKAPEGPGTFIDVPPIVVNLSTTGRQPRFLQIKLKVELESPADQKPFEAVMPRVVDQFQTFLRELRVDDLNGSAGLYRMKIELLNRVRAATPDVKVRDVLFQEMLVQ